MGGRIQNYIILMEEKMNTDANKTIDFEKKLKEKLKLQLMCTIIWYKDYVNTLILNTCH